MQSAEIELRNNREGLEKSAGGGGREGGKTWQKQFYELQKRTLQNLQFNFWSDFNF